ncbi:MAG: GNAT family N-acetyltransferase [Prevotellaceae bacterium]|jgi:ribosomal protein S18 acetylase RimI-like enzyme|nr:GNAT family N-acetyltransferase [Prevotellaceae bacterium]
MFRDIKPSDKEPFLAMGQEFFSSTAVAHTIDPQHFVRTFDEAIGHNPYLRILIIEIDNRIVGYAQLSFTYSNEAGGMVVLIEEVYIDESQRGKGIGKKLFEFIEKEYPSAGRFRLEVARNNQRAIDLYQHLGYKVLDYLQMVK